MEKESGLLPYLFGLEYQTDEQRETLLIRQLATTEGMSSPDDLYEIKCKRNVAYHGVGLRNFRARFIPMIQWWKRPSDRHGPVSPAQSMIDAGDFIKSDINDADLHYASPYVMIPPSEMEHSHTHQWWDIFQPWGGVGRDLNSLHDVLKQSYPKIFDGGWMDEALMFASNSILDSYNTDGGSHFPHIINTLTMGTPRTQFSKINIQ